MPPDGPDSWPEADSRNQWLVFYRLDQMTLNGTGIIEGNGDQWWDLPCKPHRVIISYLVTIINFHPINVVAIYLMLNEITLNGSKKLHFRVPMEKLFQDHVIALQ